MLVLLHVNSRCPVEVKFIRSRPAGQNHTGRKRVAASTYEAKQTVWLLSLGRPCWRVSWFLSFPPRCLLSPLFCFLLALVFFLLLCTAFGVCVWFINPQGATLREGGKGERRRKRDSRRSEKELEGSANAIFNHLYAAVGRGVHTLCLKVPNVKNFTKIINRMWRNQQVFVLCCRDIYRS